MTNHYHNYPIFTSPEHSMYIISIQIVTQTQAPVLLFAIEAKVEIYNTVANFLALHFVALNMHWCDYVIYVLIKMYMKASHMLKIQSTITVTSHL